MVDKRNENGYIVLEENIDVIIADVLRMKSGTSKFRKRYGDKVQQTTGTVVKAYQQTKDKPFKEKLFKVLGGVAEMAIPALLSRISGVDLSIFKGSGLSFTTFFK